MICGHVLFGWGCGVGWLAGWLCDLCSCGGVVFCAVRGLLEVVWLRLCIFARNLSTVSLQLKKHTIHGLETQFGYIQLLLKLSKQRANIAW